MAIIVWLKTKLFDHPWKSIMQGHSGLLYFIKLTKVKEQIKTGCFNKMLTNDDRHQIMSITLCSRKN